MFGLFACPDLDDVAGVAREGAATARVPAAHTLRIGAPLAGRNVDHEPDFVPRRDAAAARALAPHESDGAVSRGAFRDRAVEPNPKGGQPLDTGAPRRGGLRTRRCARPSPRPSAASTGVGTPVPERPAGRGAL